MSICLFFIAHRRLKKKQPSYEHIIMLCNLEAVAHRTTRNIVQNKATKISCRSKTHDSAHT